MDSLSSDNIILLAGLVFILLAILGGIKIKSSSSDLISANIRIPLGLLGILMLIYGGYSYGAINLQGQIEQVETGNKLKVDYPVEEVQIISPVEGDVVECRILTMGVYPESHDKDIWVMLKPSNNMYYPQSDHTNTSYKRNGEWQVITRFGGDEGEAYEVIAYEADPAASEFFSSTIQEWKDNLSYPGLEFSQLPEGAVEADRVFVSLQENCRGVF